MSELVRLEVSDGVATITLDSPHNRNALSAALVGQLNRALDDSAADDRAKVVVLRSSGRVFCSGADMSEAADVGMEQGSRTLIALMRQIVAHP